MALFNRSKLSVHCEKGRKKKQTTYSVLWSGKYRNPFPGSPISIMLTFLHSIIEVTFSSCPEMNLIVNAGGKSGRKPVDISLSESATVKDLKATYGKIVRKSIHRLSFKFTKVVSPLWCLVLYQTSYTWLKMIVFKGGKSDSFGGRQQNSKGITVLYLFFFHILHLPFLALCT